MLVQCVGVSECFNLLNSSLIPWTTLKGKKKEKNNPHLSIGAFVCVCALLRLSAASFEFALQSLTKPLLAFDHFPLLTLSLHLPPDPTFLPLSPSTSCLLSLSPSPGFISMSPPRTLFASSLFFVSPLWTYLHCGWERERERDIRLGIKSSGRCVSTWIPAHLVIAVSEPSDNSLNCLPSNLWRDWGGNESLKKAERWQRE